MLITNSPAIRRNSAMARACETILAAVRAYLPPGGISKDALINLVIEAVDNPEFNAALAESIDTDKLASGWAIGHQEHGMISETACVDGLSAVKLFCDAIGVDWEDAKEQGYYLTRFGDSDL